MLDGHQTRRYFLCQGALLAAAAVSPHLASSGVQPTMYGLIGRIQTSPGAAAELASILVEGVAGMPGCLSYVVARDHDDSDSIWVTEVWDSQESHEASLSLPSVQEAIAKGRPLILGFFDRTVTQPIGGYGLE